MLAGLAGACGSGGKGDQAAILPYLADVRDSAGQAPADPDAPLYELTGHPLLAPDGHDVTLRELESASGTAVVTCTALGTKANLSLRHLLPNAVYSVWNATFVAPGYDGTEEYVNAFGAAGAGQGADNWFVTSAAGDGGLDVTTPAGPLSVTGSISACGPRDEVDYALFIIFHLDGQTHGPVPGAPGTGITQLVVHPDKQR